MSVPESSAACLELWWVCDLCVSRNLHALDSPRVTFLTVTRTWCRPFSAREIVRQQEHSSFMEEEDFISLIMLVLGHIIHYISITGIVGSVSSA